MSQERRAILKEGQAYFDEPVYLLPNPVPVLDQLIMKMFGREPPKKILKSYERIMLRWIKPDPNGKLISR